MFSIEDYQYDLPEELIAQVPSVNRSDSCLLLVERSRTSFSSHRFRDLPGLLDAGDLLVVNDTRVVPARLLGRKETGGRFEALVLEHQGAVGYDSNSRWCLVKASKRPRKGGALLFDGGACGLVEELAEGGLAKIAFQGEMSPEAFMERCGAMPLPPYIKRTPGDALASMDRRRYQTVYANIPGAVAAPTAGLHFTDDLLSRLREANVAVAALTLHVGHGTFCPVRVKDIRDHRVGEEIYEVPPAAAEAVNRARKERRRVIAVGTTVVRTLETAADASGRVKAGRGKTNLMILPGHRFKAIDAMITNFHLPGSSLLFLVAAFAGLECIKRAYAHAIEKRFRFYSYGDAMLIV
jgi:S-adenosylmethionine:tRNA ribosyltransferase-isomerase